MRKIFLRSYSIIMALCPVSITALLIMRTKPAQQWNSEVICILIVFGIAAFIASILTWKASNNTAKQKAVEMSSMFTMEYGDELLLTDGEEIIAHLPNNRIS